MGQDDELVGLDGFGPVRSRPVRPQVPQLGRGGVPRVEHGRPEPVLCRPGGDRRVPRCPPGSGSHSAGRRPAGPPATGRVSAACGERKAGECYRPASCGPLRAVPVFGVLGPVPRWHSPRRIAGQRALPPAIRGCVALRCRHGPGTAPPGRLQGAGTGSVDGSTRRGRTGPCRTDPRVRSWPITARGRTAGCTVGSSPGRHGRRRRGPGATLGPVGLGPL